MNGMDRHKRFRRDMALLQRRAMFERAKKKCPSLKNTRYEEW